MNCGGPRVQKTKGRRSSVDGFWALVGMKLGVTRERNLATLSEERLKYGRLLIFAFHVADGVVLFRGIVGRS